MIAGTFGWEKESFVGWTAGRHCWERENGGERTVGRFDWVKEFSIGIRGVDSDSSAALTTGGFGWAAKFDWAGFYSNFGSFIRR